MKSRIQTVLDDPQRPLRLVRSDQRIDLRLVTAQPSMLAAIKLCISAAGFDAGKEVYSELGIDAGHWARILRGEAHFPVNKLHALMDLCGNEAPLQWLVHDRGYDVSSLRFRENELEKSNRELREEVAALRRVLEVKTP